MDGFGFHLDASASRTASRSHRAANWFQPGSPRYATLLLRPGASALLSNEALSWNARVSYGAE
jgi:hypothetical protein